MRREDGRELQAYYEEEADRFPGKVAWLFAEMKETAAGEKPGPQAGRNPAGDPDTIVSRNARERVVSASMIKVPVLLYLLEQYGREDREGPGNDRERPAGGWAESETGHCAVEEGPKGLDQRIRVGTEVICPDSLVFEYGPREASLRELAVWMIVNSDNTSTNALIDFLGMDRLNHYFQFLGLHGTRLERRMLDWSAVSAGHDNYISPADFLTCMKRIYDGRRDDPMMAQAWRILCGNRDYGSLLRYLYELPVCAHKTGGLDNVAHDGGILQTPAGDYFLGIFVSGFEGVPAMCTEAERLIGRMSRRAYDLFVYGK